MARAQTRPFGRLAVDRIGQLRGLRLATAAVMVGFVVMVCVVMVVVVGGGELFGHTVAPSPWLSVLGTAIVAVAVEPAQPGVNRRLSRALHRDRTWPYQMPARYPRTVTGAFPEGGWSARMVRALTEGTDTVRAEVRLAHGRLEHAAGLPGEPTHQTRGPHPSPTAVFGRAAIAACATVATPRLGQVRPGAAPLVAIEGRRHSMFVRGRYILLGALTVVASAGPQLHQVEERALTGMAAHSSRMLRVTWLRVELERQNAALERLTSRAGHG